METLCVRRRVFLRVWGWKVQAFLLWSLSLGVDLLATSKTDRRVQKTPSSNQRWEGKKVRMLQPNLHWTVQLLLLQPFRCQQASCLHTRSKTHLTDAYKATQLIMINILTLDDLYIYFAVLFSSRSDLNWPSIRSNRNIEIQFLAPNISDDVGKDSGLFQSSIKLFRAGSKHFQDRVCWVLSSLLMTIIKNPFKTFRPQIDCREIYHRTNPKSGWFLNFQHVTITSLSRTQVQWLNLKTGCSGNMQRSCAFWLFQVLGVQ